MMQREASQPISWDEVFDYVSQVDDLPPYTAAALGGVGLQEVAFKSIPAQRQEQTQASEAQ